MNPRFPNTQTRMWHPRPWLQRASRPSLALLAGMVAGLFGHSDAKAATTPTSTHEPTALIITDLAQCGKGEFVLFTVLWQGVVGVAGEPLLIGWDKPKVGDRLTGAFLAKGWMEGTNIESGASTYLVIQETGVPIAEQNRLLQTYCQKR
jgi:hypothetical protein